MHHTHPWQQQKWQYLVKRRNASQLPHAILIKGREGLGKSYFAQSLAELLLCQKSLEKMEACGVCDACQLLQANNHPDLIIIRPEEQGKAIKIDQIRELIIDLNNTSHQGGFKIVIIESADMLNVAAANSLLKTLEEPDPHTIIILITAHPMGLPATIRSRCQTLSIDVPEYIIAEKWLKQQIPEGNIKLLLALAENAPLKALDLAKEEDLNKRLEFFSHLDALQQGKINSVQMAAKCLNLGLENLLITFMYLANDLIKIKFAAIETIVNQDQLEMLSNFAGKTSISRLFAYKDKLIALRQHLANKINLNQQLIAENVIIGWMKVG